MLKMIWFDMFFYKNIWFDIFAKKLPFILLQIVYYTLQRGEKMLEKLRIKAIYDDFIANVKLTNEQVKILDMLLNKDSILKISMEIGASERTIGYEIKKLKDLYNNYYNMQLSKIFMLMD